MKSEIFIILVIGLYYRFVYRKSDTSQETNKYFMIFIGVYLLLWYFMNFQRDFVYKVALNMHNAEKKNYYDLLPLEDNINQGHIMQQHMMYNQMMNQQMMNQQMMSHDRDFIQERYRTDQLF